jgi:hypothetical protein
MTAAAALVMLCMLDACSQAAAAKEAMLVVLDACGVCKWLGIKSNWN